MEDNNGYKVVTNDNNKNSKLKRFMIILIVIFVTFICTSIGIYIYLSKNPTLLINGVSTENTNSIDNSISLYKAIIDKYYLGEVNEEELKEGAIKGYIDALGDPYTEYISAKELESYKDDIKGNFDGIGIYMVKDTSVNKVLILSPIKNSPAEKAGILPGDYINSVDGVEYTADQMTEVANKIKGESGTTVKIEIIRDNEKKTFEIKRENIDLNPIEGKVIDNDIGYISFSSFDEKTATEFKKKYEELAQSNIKSLIIDLRNNGGGIVDQAISVAGTILDKDSVVIYEVDKNNNEKEMKTTDSPIINIPIVVLVNNNTASASEILAGALKDYDKAKIVGEKTYGKGVIQQLLTLPNGSGIKITCAEYLTPKRNKINKIGIEPNETVVLPDDVKESYSIPIEKDTQLQKAIEILKP